MIKKVIVLFVCCITTALHADTFKVADIRVEGLQRLPAEQVYSELSVSVGDEVSALTLASIAKNLFKSGNFHDVQMGRDNDVLVLLVTERPTISRLEIKGNKQIDKEQLLKGLKESGLAEGMIFKKATLESIELELQRQYVSQGRYGAKVETTLTPQPRNRVAIDIQITEGKTANIAKINFVGNKDFTDDELRNVLSMKQQSFRTILKSSDKYSRQKLSADLEAIRSHYLDRGYVRFRIDSNPVSITPDKKDIFITLNLEEGSKYTVSEVNLAGDLVVSERMLRPLVIVKKGKVYSQQAVTYTGDLITQRLGNEGYTFASVNTVPVINDKDNTVALTFFIDPGKRTYVRKIIFTGNAKTGDEVLRREMRQFESAPASGALIERSRQRLQRLGYFGAVDVDTQLVPGEDDLVDVVFNVEEQPSGSVGANLGYSENGGLTLGAEINQSNFFGSGNSVAFSMNHSEFRNSYNFSFFDPYFTDDGISRGYSMYFTETDYSNSKASVSDYAIDRKGLSVNFGYPINEYERLGLAFGVDNAEVASGIAVSQAIYEFLQTNGDNFDTYTATGTWSRSTLNRGIFATRGASNVLALELALPFSDADYYRATYRGEKYIPVGRRSTFRFRGEWGFGDSLSGGQTLPFYKNFRAGGYGSVRGFESGSLGPRSPSRIFEDLMDPSPVLIGGNLLTEGSVEFVTPPPFAKNSRSLRFVAFVDGGNVFQTEPVHPSNLLDINNETYDYEFDGSEIRYSYGAALNWLSPLGPISFTLAWPLNAEDIDDERRFQFNLGQSF